MIDTNDASINDASINGASEAFIGAVRVADITQEMQTAYLDYAMSVIVARALPDVRDGLKPVHRRILYAMWHDLSLTHDKPHKKSARIVGEVLGKYHPHGDAAVYDAMVRMAQPFSLRYPLIDGQGNFGSIDGDNAAAMRYTEARLARIADRMLEDLEKDTVDWHDNFDNTLREPDILPAALPNLLINGSSGIAVGMATNIPPHNLGEVVDALTYMIDHYDNVDAITTEALMRFMKGPDFPTGGILYRYREENKGEEEADAIAQGYSVGKSRLILQAKAHFEEISRGRTRIVITELPYQTNKTALLERIADLVRNGKIEGIGDLRDESDRTGMRIVIELTRGTDPKAVLADLFKYTPLQQTFGMQLLALVDGQPRLLSLKRMLQLFIQHRQEIIRRRSEFDLKKAKARAHIVEGLLRALDILDEVIQTIRRSQTVETARNNLMHNFKFTELQAQAILDMQLRRLAALERKKLQEEYKELKQRIAYLEDLLANPHKVLGVIKEELLAIKQKFGDARRTQIVDRAKGALTTTDLLPDQRVWVSLGKNGDLRRQAAGRPGASIVRQVGKDSQVALLTASTRDYLYVFSKDGRCSRIGIHEIPEEGSKKVAELTGFTGRDTITAALALPRERNGDEGSFIFLVTEQGIVKRVRTEDVQSNPGSEFTVINVDAGDRLLWAFRTQGEQEVILVSAQGQSIRFSEGEVRSMGLPAGGVSGMKLRPNDRVVYAGVVDPAGELLTGTRAGFAKRSPLTDYSAQGRNGGGMITHKVTDRTGEVAAALVLSTRSESDWLVFVTARGVAKPMLAVEVPAMGRSVQGKALVELSSQDAIVAVWRIEGPKGEKAEEQREEKEASRTPIAGTRSIIKRSTTKRSTIKQSATEGETIPVTSQPPVGSGVKPGGSVKKMATDKKSTSAAGKGKSSNVDPQPSEARTSSPLTLNERKKKMASPPQTPDEAAPLVFEFIEQVPAVQHSKGGKSGRGKSKLSAVVSVPEAQVKTKKKPKA